MLTYEAIVVDLQFDGLLLLMRDNYYYHYYCFYVLIVIKDCIHLDGRAAG